MSNFYNCMAFFFFTYKLIMDTFVILIQLKLDLNCHRVYIMCSLIYSEVLLIKKHIVKRILMRETTPP